MKDENKDNDLWIEVVKDVLPLKDRGDTSLKKQQIKTVSTKYQGNISTAIPKDTYTPELRKGSELDRNTHTRLKRGKMQIEGRLDLHGMTQNQAYDALLSFIPCAYSNGKRCLLIITGKGNKQNSSTSLTAQNIGVLRQKTPEWLGSSPLSQYILKIETARQNHGGQGALYVLLRRKRV